MPIDLSALSFAVTAGDFLRLDVLGDWRAGENADFTDTREDTVGLFSSSKTLLDGSNLNRVPDALAAGVGFVTDPTFFGGISTDIPQDFLVGRTESILTSVDIRVPTEAKFLFIAAQDSFYGDNSDPDRDYMIQIRPLTAVPEHSTWIGLVIGFAAVIVFRKVTCSILMASPGVP